MIRRFVPLFLLGSLVACGSSSPTTPTPLNVPYSQTDLIVGTGAEAVNGKTLSVNYTGWLYSTTAADHKGQQFDTSAGGAVHLRPGRRRRHQGLGSGPGRDEGRRTP